RELARDQAFDVRTRGFVVFRSGAVVSYFRVRQDDDLAGVRRVGEDFLVAGDAGIKNDFPVALAFCSVTFAAEDSAVFQGEDRLHAVSEEWILLILAERFHWRNAEFGQSCGKRRPLTTKGTKVHEGFLNTSVLLL